MEPTEHTMTSWDGTELFYRAWIPACRPTRRSCFFIAATNIPAAGRKRSMLLLSKTSRCSPGMRAVMADRRANAGPANNLSDVIKDVDAFARHISEQHGIPLENMIVLAHSVGAVSVAAWVHDYAPPIRAMILATAAFRVRLYVPLAIPPLRLKQRLFGPGQVKSYVKANMLTHDRSRRRSTTPIRSSSGRSRSTFCSIFTTPPKRLLADAGAIQTADADARRRPRLGR